MRCHASHFGIILSALAIPCAAWAQTSGSLAVQVNVPSGSPAGLVVVASFSFPDTAAGLSGPRAFASVTNTAGQISFTGLPFGVYSVCAEPANGILIEQCQWAPPVTARLTSQNPAGSVNLTVPMGIPVDIRIDDPGGLLSTPATNQGLSVSVATPAGPWRLRPVIQDSGGVNYRIIAPPNVAASFQIAAGSLRIVDGTGSAVNFSAGVAPSFSLNATSTGQFFRYRLQSGQ